MPATSPAPREEGRRECAGCGKAFELKRWNQTRCRPNCGRARASEAKRTQKDKNRARAATRAAPKTFIGIDGEGVTDEETGEHRYVMIRCGEHYFSHDGAHLEFTEILNFLWSEFIENPTAVYVGFYLKYDFGQWFRTLPENRARTLLDPKFPAFQRRARTVMPHLPPFPVEYYGWQFDYLPGKRFVFRPVPPPRLVGEKQRERPFMCINDAGSFFQSSFLKAVNPRDNPQPVVTAAEYEILDSGKGRRARAVYDPAMIEYNKLECEALARLMSQLEEGTREVGLRLKRNQWHGPGQVAQQWMRKIGVPTGAEVAAVTPKAAWEAARSSYFGGWFEIFWHGPVEGKSYSYDINSAYPWIMSGLPCLLHGRWEPVLVNQGRGKWLTWEEKGKLPRLGVAFVRAAVRGRHPVVGTMLHRAGNRTESKPRATPKGVIQRPQETEGWFVLSELMAALDAGFVERIKLFEGWYFHQDCSCPPPLGPIAELYQRRLDAGKASPLGKALKLIYNSCAGKTMQSVGHPVFGNAIYATLITSGCRRMITDAIRSHPEGARELLMVATDGVTFRRPHDKLPLDKERLGAWTPSEHDNLSLFMPGFYWDDASRERIAKGEAPVFKSRGIPAKDLAKHIDAIDRAWARFETTGWPAAKLPISFQVVSPKQALDRGKWKTCGTVSTDKTRDISAKPAPKRLAFRPGRSLPFAKPDDPVSLPYSGTFSDELRAFAEAEFGDHPDGPLGEQLAEAIYG